MHRVIRVTDAVYRKLQRRAKPFEDTPCSVIERLLDMREQRKDGQADPKPNKTRPGITDEIKKILMEGPVTREQILAKLVEKFPGRSAKAMRKTINGQLLWHLPQKSIQVKSSGKGREHKFWIE